jgi:hypothetical protein
VDYWKIMHDQTKKINENRTTNKKIHNHEILQKNDMFNDSNKNTLKHDSVGYSQ